MATQSRASATVPIPIQVCYEMFIEMCKEKRIKIASSDSTNHLIHLAGAYKADVTFKSFGDEKTSLAVTASTFGMADISDTLSSNLIEPFVARVSARLEAEARSVLSGLTPEKVLCLEQPVPAEAEQPLQDLREGLSAYVRKDAVKALGALTESNERIVAALIMARETDKHDIVRTEAVEALLSPVHQAILQQNPEWVSQVVAQARVGVAGQLQVEQKAMEKGRSANYAIRSGVGILIVGIVALVLPLLGYELLWLGFIPTGQPIIGIGIAALGLALIIFGYRSSK